MKTSGFARRDDLAITQENFQSKLPQIAGRYEAEILADWTLELKASLVRREDLINDGALHEQCRRFLSLFMQTIQVAKLEDLDAPEWAEMREFLTEVSATRAHQGFSPAEVATFIFSLKRPIFTRIRKELSGDQDRLFLELWVATELLDKLGLYTTEMYQKAREEVISRQQAEMLELSTPVVKLWDGVLALPMIGTLDSTRTQIVMESLLQRIVETGSEIVILDITGVPTVDTLVAQHLIKTASAARLMGAQCIISGIRPQIAQTMVHLGIDLKEVLTKSTLADAFVVALQKRGFSFQKKDAQASTLLPTRVA